MSKSNGQTPGQTVDISYICQRTPIDGDPPVAETVGWVNITEPDKRRGAVHNAARNARAAANERGLSRRDVRIRVLKVVVTVDETGF